MNERSQRSAIRLLHTPLARPRPGTCLRSACGTGAAGRRAGATAAPQPGVMKSPCFPTVSVDENGDDYGLRFQISPVHRSRRRSRQPIPAFTSIPAIPEPEAPATFRLCSEHRQDLPALRFSMFDVQCSMRPRPVVCGLPSVVCGLRSAVCGLQSPVFPL